MDKDTLRAPVGRAMSMPTATASSLGNDPWYRQKFECFRDVIEEKIREHYPDVPAAHKLEPKNIERSTEKGSDLDFPIDLHDGRSAVVSVACAADGRPPCSKDERSKLVAVRQFTTEN